MHAIGNWDLSPAQRITAVVVGSVHNRRNLGLDVGYGLRLTRPLVAPNSAALTGYFRLVVETGLVACSVTTMMTVVTGTGALAGVDVGRGAHRDSLWLGVRAL
jgi:hypothetical protein